MKALDTNILVRFILKDESTEKEKNMYAAAKGEMLSNDVFISEVAFSETLWVLQKVYKRPQAIYMMDLRAIAGFENVTLENPQRIANALNWHEKGLDFRDALILAVAQEKQCAILKTLDEPFFKKGKGKTKVSVEYPDGYSPKR